MLPHRLFAPLVCGALLAMLCALPLAAMELITEAEANLPTDKSQVRALSRGPLVFLINPAPNAGLIRSPFTLKLKFESFGGAHVDPDRVVITYKKLPPIDLTQRVKTFINEDGMSVDGVQVPPGEHYIRVDIGDTRGNKGWTDFIIRVSK